MGLLAGLRPPDLYHCPKGKVGHHWLVDEYASIFSGDNFELTAYCRECGFDVALDGELADWMQEKFLKANLQLQKKVADEQRKGVILRASPLPWTAIPSSEDPRKTIAGAMRKSGFFDEDEIGEYEPIEEKVLRDLEPAPEQHEDEHENLRNTELDEDAAAEGGN